MGSRYSADHIAKDHIHIDITYNTEESQQKYRLGTVSNRLLGGLQTSLCKHCKSRSGCSWSSINCFQKKNYLNFRYYFEGKSVYFLAFTVTVIYYSISFGI